MEQRRGRGLGRNAADTLRAPPSAAVRRRTWALAAIGGSGVAVLFAAESLRIWRLGRLPLTRGDYALADVASSRSPRAVARVLREGYKVSSTRENAIFNMVASFVISFATTRGITHTIRTRGHIGPIKNITTGSGRHIHHFIPGVTLALLAGGWSIASQRQDLDRWFALPFGVGAAMILDESALLLELEDVYWTEEGVVSVQVAFAALGLLAALAYLTRVRRQGEAGTEVDWETAARAFDQLKLLPGRGDR